MAAMRIRRTTLLCIALASTLVTQLGCVTVKPQQRGVLSDPIMRFGGNGHDGVEQGQVKHALSNREGAFGGDGVAGGGCGCN
jgi:hypothetical protein